MKLLKAIANRLVYLIGQWNLSTIGIKYSLLSRSITSPFIIYDIKVNLFFLDANYPTEFAKTCRSYRQSMCCCIKIPIPTVALWWLNYLIWFLLTCYVLETIALPKLKSCQVTSIMYFSPKNNSLHQFTVLSLNFKFCNIL